MKKSVLNTALSTAFIVAFGVGVSACGGESHEVLAVDRVDEAAALARANAPAAEEMDFPETAPVAAAADGAAVDGAATTDADMPMATEGAAATEDLAVNVGAELYNNQCMACHANGLLNAPKYGDTAAWAPRIAKGIDTLTTHSVNGFNQMPAQAYNGVTEAQAKAVVDYMLASVSCYK